VFLRGSGPSSVRPWTPAGRRRRPVLDHLGSVRPLARAFGLGHGAVVEQSPKYPPDDRTKDVKPHAR
jgi:hypothetical protein